MSKVLVKDIVKFRPQMPGYEQAGREWALKDVLFEYYAKHFNRSQAQELVNQYVMLLQKEFESDSE